MLIVLFRVPKNSHMKKVIFLLILLFLETTVIAQTDQRPGNNKNSNNKNINNNRIGRLPQISVGVIGMDPEGAFDTNYSGNPIGLGAQLAIPMGNAPIDLVAGFAWYSRGGSKEDITIFQGNDSEGDDFYTDGEMSVNSNIYAYDAIIRFRPFNGRVQPYGDVIGGFQTYSTKSIIRTLDGSNADETENAHRDFSVNFGWGAGVKVRISEIVAVEARFTNIQGSEVKFVDKESVLIDRDGNVQFENIRSTTDHYTFQAGVSFQL